ncbi:MAG: metal-dependent hydrolase, partial [Desulfurococcaceae archaeon]|nr:metal-dependent hydrolase [Desulfurococcaceae archaeon]
VARTRVGTRRALLLGLLGLLPDVDALLRVHRWSTHSLVVIALSAVPLLALVYVRRRGWVGLALLALLIVALHPVADVFTGQTPVLWPLADSVWVRVSVSGVSSSTGVAVAPSIEVITSRPDFTQRGAVEGPVVAEVGIVLAVATAAVLVLDHLPRARNGR